MGKRGKKKLLSEVIDSELLDEFGIHCAYEKYCGDMTLEDLFTTDSVYLAAKECACGFQSRPDTQAFMRAAWKNSQGLCQRVLTGRFVPRYYPEKLINERGKMRVIKPPHFECKVVQKVLCNAILRAVLESRMIYTNYASIRGKGTHKLYADVLKGINEAGRKLTEPVIVMTDFTDFFGSIDNDILEREVFERYMSDRRVTALLRSFSPGPRGLSLGNEVSQVPASFFPSPVDHWVKDDQRQKFYYRYADDIFLVTERWDAPRLIDGIVERSGRIGLTIKDEKIRVLPYGTNFVYCKERYIFNREQHYYYTLINPTIPRRQTHKIDAFAGKIAAGTMKLPQAQDLQKCVIGIIASHPNTRKTVQRLDERFDRRIPAAVYMAQERLSV